MAEPDGLLPEADPDKPAGAAQNAFGPNGSAGCWHCSPRRCCWVAGFL